MGSLTDSSKMTSLSKVPFRPIAARSICNAINQKRRHDARWKRVEHEEVGEASIAGRVIWAVSSDVGLSKTVELRLICT